MKLFTSKKGIFFVIFLFVFILFSIFAIFLIDSSSKSTKTYSNDYANLKTEINNLNISNNSLGQRDYDAVKDLLNQIEKTDNKKEQYNSLVLVAQHLKSLYSYTNEPSLYKIINNDLANYAKKNYPTYVDSALFTYSCQDSNCAADPQPKQIIEIIDAIKKSDFPQYAKESYTQDLTNIGYRNKKEEQYAMVAEYLAIELDLKLVDDFSKTGANKIIAKRLLDYVKTTFPEEYKRAVIGDPRYAE